MKKTFWIGFVIGIVYFIITYLFEVFGSGCPWSMNEGMCGLGIAWANIPSALILQTIGINSGIFGFIVIPLINGLILGSLFVLLKKIFIRPQVKSSI